MPLSEKRILVTGGAGYIGSHVCYALKATNAKVTIFDNLSTGFSENIHHGTLVTVDLSDWAAVDHHIADLQPHAVIHFAGSIVVPESVKDPIKYYRNNTANTLHLLQSCVAHGVTNALFSSTAAVYGIPSTGICSEDDPLQPINPYGRSKLMTELMLQDIALASDLNYVALRYFNVAGAHPNNHMGQRMPDATHLIKIIAQVVTKQRDHLAIFGTDYPTPDGTCIRDYIHVCDLANAHVLALRYLMNGGESTVFNCGYSNGYSVKDVVDTAKALYGDFHVKLSGRRDGDPPQLIANAQRIKNTLGWVPTHNHLDDMIRSAIEFERTLAP
ncbi:MAG: UDP-glucose 4-epimerase GalE [Candidatus Margulisbacteria bacterium]|nr:UDP-glucose 4-epimerase GalE [Candidatus Margulisiibacteriota bacterium]